MKKKVRATLLAALLATSTILSGCGAQETISMGTGGRPSGIHMSEGAKYQYQSVEPSDIIVEYSGLKPDCSLDKVDGTYLLDSSVYEGDTFGIYLDGEYFDTTIEEYVPYSDIQWAMVDNTEFWSVYGSRATSDMIDTSMIEGKVIYADGSEMVIEPERVWGTLGGGEVDYKLSVVYRDKVYEVSSPCPWLDWDMSGSDGEVADVSGSVVLNPEGTEVISDSETSASTESIGEGFATLDEFYASDLYRKLEDIFAKEWFQRDTFDSSKYNCGYTEYELWTLFPLFLEEHGRLSELSKLESINIRTVDENDEYEVLYRNSNLWCDFIGIYNEVMSPYGKDGISLAAEWNELKNKVSGWFDRNVEYYIGGTYEVLDKLVLENYDFTGYEEIGRQLYCVEITRVLPECDLDLHGHTLEDMGYEDYSIGTKVYYDLPFPKDVSRSDWGIPEEGTVLNYDDYRNMHKHPNNFFEDWLMVLD